MRCKLFYGIVVMNMVFSINSYSQIKKDSIVKIEKEKKVIKLVKEEAQNVMLNASNDNGPRNVNIGLPASIGGTTILENGLPVVYNWASQNPTSAWRAGSGFSKFQVQTVGETAISIGDVGVSVSTYSNRGTEKHQQNLALNSNGFGLLRGDVSFSGPLKNDWYYAGSVFLNFDPGTFKSDFTDYFDKTQIYKGVISKRYNAGKGEISVQYKFANSEGISSKVSPYTYNLDGTVSQFGDFKIGRNSYLERSGKSIIINPITGQREILDQMKDMGSTTNAIDIMGNNRLGNGMKLDYVVRYQNAKSGLYNPYFTSLRKIDDSKNRYVYVDNQNEVYQGDYVQGVLALNTPKISQNTIMGRVDLSKKTQKHHWSIGLNEFNYKIDDYYQSTYNMIQEVAANPSKLITQIKDSNGNWVNDSRIDEYGNSGYNAALQYYSGRENKLALYGTEKWIANEKLEFNFGARLEWQRIDGFWYPKSSRDAAKEEGFQNNQIDMSKRQSIQKDWFNKAFTASFLHKTFDNIGFLADISYTEVAGNLSNYSGADDPNISPSQIPGASAGTYFNHPLVSLVSKITYIQRNNFKNNSSFQGGHKQTITYDIQTIGWTTDMEIKPFKGFKFHALLTLQNPEYKNFVVDLSEVAAEGNKIYDFSGGTARSVSKVLVELDPSYSYKNWRVWVSTRYFSKEAANYPNTLFFASRWETFGGVACKLNKKIDLNLNVVNFLNQKGAQGSISGTNTTTAEEAQAFDGRPLVGTYMRPFTVEFGIKVKL
ncbi:hypothetical protein LNQ49_18495 [Flavobacterium sp. F-65]|uniref:Outer membrane receptor proteins, mostly Fe transport n=1 Tax=Flavobacterium pisciphilum TaxID=2893755 RepID=A0ABS8MZH4_9FLAO|nr:hypothetical protein [Flavobacterium sp. F-65]MCC9073571.1 hypothetical protein [Flavobacterium sp. F-65]